MTSKEFFSALDKRIAKYDLLCHPFYKAWSAGELTTEDLREYAQDYYHHVKAFPTYLAEFAVRLEGGQMRDAVLANMADEKGVNSRGESDAVEHAELWLDFAEAMGASRSLAQHQPIAEIGELMDHFHGVASQGTSEEALAAFYAYESQVPRVAEAKDQGLREMYGTDAKGRGYFTLHATADVFHSRVWRNQLAKCVEANPASAEGALVAAENAAKALWRALDGIESRRVAAAA